MSKLVINPLISGFPSVATLNANFDAIEAALENTLSRNGTTPNQMSADLDMNGYRVLNALAHSGEGFIYEGAWTTSTAYTLNTLVYVPVGTGSFYDGFTLICRVSHTSGTLNTDYSEGKWEIIAARGASGGGSGDLVSTNNLADVASVSSARSNLSAAKSGANNDITSLSALPLAIATAGTTQASALTALGAALNGVLSKSANYSVVSSDRGKLIDYTSAPYTLTLPDVVVGDGFTIGVKNSASNGTLTIGRNSANIDGMVADITLAPGESCLIVCDGTGWKMVGSTANKTCAVTGSTTPVAHNTWTTLLWPTDIFDPGDWHNTSTNTDRITVPQTGIYKIAATVSFYIAANNTFSVGLKLLKNGATTLQHNVQVAPGGVTTDGVNSCSTFVIVSLTAGDYITAQALHESGSTIAPSAGTPQLVVEKMG